MNIGIVTWVTYHNYGTFLQAYALQETLRKMGHNPHLIDDSHLVKKYLKLVKPAWKVALLPLIKMLQCIWSDEARTRLKMSRSYKNFRSKYLNIVDNQKSELIGTDLYVTGSDQVWSPIASPLTDSFTEIYSHYFLAFTDNKKISYAPSVKIDDYDTHRDNLISQWLESYSHISVRESYGAKALSKITDKRIDIVLDPTLLLEANDWKKITPPNSHYSVNNQYIACYFLRFSNFYLQRVREFAKLVGLKVIIISPHKGYGNCEFQLIFPGPDEFVNIISNSSYMFTDSFHGSVFSILSHRNFMTFENEEKGAVNGRISDLFSKLGIPERLTVASKRPLVTVNEMNGIDYENVDYLLSVERERCLSWLNNAIND